MNIAEIKKYLKNHGITYKVLSEKSGVPESTLKNIFGGFTPNPRIDTVEAIERALGINEKSPTVRDAQSDIAENFVKEFGDLFSDETFVKYARLYKMMNAAQRLMILGVIIGHLENAGISVPPMLR